MLTVITSNECARCASRKRNQSVLYIVTSLRKHHQLNTITVICKTTTRERDHFSASQYICLLNRP